jgi:hypothetical protein
MTATKTRGHATSVRPRPTTVNVTSTAMRVASALGGSAALGLLTAAALPAVPIAALVAAGVGLAGGVFAVTKLNRPSGSTHRHM